MNGKRYALLCMIIILSCSLCGCNSEEQYQRLYEDAEEMISEEEYDLVINAYSTMIDIYPDKVETYIARGNAYINEGENYENLTAAIKDYKEALELEPDNVDIYVALIDAYIRSNAFEVAEELLSEARQKFKDDRLSTFEVGFGDVTMLQDLDGNTRKMISHNPYDETQLQWYVVYLYKNGRTSEAILYDEQETEQCRLVYEYDSHGNCLQQLSLSIYEELEIRNSTYDEKDRIITTVYRNLEGEITERLEWEYFGDKDIKISYNADGTMNWREVTDYDANGDIIRVTDYDANGEITYQQEY